MAHIGSSEHEVSLHMSQWPVIFLTTKLQVRAQTFGNPDRRRLFAQTWTFSATAGAIYPLTERVYLNFSLFYTPLWVKRPPDTDSQNDPLFNVRAAISYRWG